MSDTTRLRRLIWLAQGAFERTEAHHREHHTWEGSPEWEPDRRILRGVMALAEAEEMIDEVEKELRQANFFRDRLAERLSLAETAVVELEGALACDAALDSQHWRAHAQHAMESALGLCRRATKTVRGKDVPKTG